MASIRETKTREGIAHQVRWREDGRETSVTIHGQIEVAEIFAGILDTDGSKSAFEWLEARTPEPENPADVWTVDRIVGHHIEHLTAITPGTRAKYLSDYRRTFGAVELDGKRFGGLRAEVVLRDHVARAVNQLAEDGRVSNGGRPLSRKSIANAHGVLSAAFQTAVNHPHIPLVRNPCEGVRLPTDELSEDDPDDAMVCLEPAEFARLYGCMPTYWRPMLLTLYATGMRWGECTALQVKNVNLDAARIRVARAWKESDTAKHVAGAPKKGSRRTVQISPELVAALRPLLAGRRPDDLVFTSQKAETNTSPIWRSIWTQKVWNPARWSAALCDEHCSGANPGCPADCVPTNGRPRYCTTHKTTPVPCGCEGTLKRIPRIHDLRHSHASWLIAKNVNVAVIKQRLGHKSISITVDIYGHLMDESQQVAAEATSEALSGLELPVAA